MDSRIHQLAENLIGYSNHLRPAEKVLIEVFDEGLPLAAALVSEAYKAGGLPFVSIKHNGITRRLLKEASVEQLNLTAQWEARRGQYEPQGV